MRGIATRASGPWTILSFVETLASPWVWGWSLVLLGFASGAVLGLGFDREGFLGGYGGWRRRLVRLGHVACVMLGVLQLLAALTPMAGDRTRLASACWALWRVGSFSMPLVCFLSAWKFPLRRLFVLPVACLVSAASLTIALAARGGVR